MIFGSILGVFLMDSGAFFGSQARPIMKRCFLGSQTTFCCFFIPCRKCGDRSHSKKNNVFATFCVILEALVSLLLSLFSLVFLNYLDVFSWFLTCFLYFSLFFETFLAVALFFTLLAPRRPQNECQRGAAQLNGVRPWLSRPPGERISQRCLIILYLSFNDLDASGPSDARRVGGF